MLTALQTLPRDAELLAFEAGCEDYCERELMIIWSRGRAFLHVRHVGHDRVVDVVISRRPLHTFLVEGSVRSPRTG
jgi:hypothetical protein